MMMKMKKINYSIEYNPATKEWVLYKNIEGEQSFNFYPILQSDKKTDCINKLEEIREVSNGKGNKDT